MQGEEEFWYELASHLHLPVQQCKQQTTSKEFVRWKIYLDKCTSRTTKEDWLFANVVATIQASNGKRGVKLKDCLLEFESSLPVNKPKMSLEQACFNSKSKWLGSVGFQKDK